MVLFSKIRFYSIKEYEKIKEKNFYFFSFLSDIILVLAIIKVISINITIYMHIPNFLSFIAYIIDAKANNMFMAYIANTVFLCDNPNFNN